MLVSVITPTYNRAALLDETIQSVLSQGYSRLEYLVLDDGSTDRTPELLAQYETRLTAVRHENMGETRTVNAGFEMANGEIVGVVNSDDPLLPGAIHHVVEAFRANPDAVAVYPDWAVVDKQNRFVSAQRLPDYDLASMLTTLSWGLGPGTFIRREAIKALGGRKADLVYCGDMEFWLRLAKLGQLIHLPRILATHRTHPGSISLANRGARFAFEWFGVFQKTLDQPGLPEVVRSSRERIIAQAAFIAARHYAGPRSYWAKATLYGRAWSGNLALRCRRLSTRTWRHLIRPPVVFASEQVFTAWVRLQRWRLGITPTASQECAADGRFAFSTRFLPPMWSGQAVVIGRLLKGVPEDSYRLVRRAVLSEPNAPSFINRLPGTYLDLPPERYLAGTRFAQWIRVANLFLGIVQRGPAIARALKGEQVETLIGCSGDVVDPPAAFVAARILGCRFYFYFFDDYTEQWWAEPQLRAVVRNLERVIAVCCDGLISPNEYMQQELRKRYARESFVVRNPTPWPEDVEVNVKPFERTPDEFKLVFTGAVYHLNYDVFRTILSAIDKLKDANIKLHIYTAQSVAELAQQGVKGPNLVVHHHVSEGEVMGVQRNADVLLLPFSFSADAAGLIKRSGTAKLADYLLAGRPIMAICPQDSFLGWYLSSRRCGVVIPHDDPDLVAAFIAKAIRDPVFRDELSRNARRAAIADYDPRRAQTDLLHAIGYSSLVSDTGAGRHRRNALQNDPLSIVQISGYDTLGIQVNGYLLHKYLQNRGHSSRMLVYEKRSHDPCVIQLGGATRRKLNRVAQGVQKVISTQCVLPVLSAGLTRHPWIRNCDVINLQLIHNAQFFSILSLPGLSRKRPVVLSVHDMFLFTGHCIYSLECARWETGCGDCPDLKIPFAVNADTTALNWRLKKWVFDRSPLHLVVGAPWQRERVLRSPMLSRFPVHYVPYGIDTSVYRPRDIRACRERLGIPMDADVIAFRAVPFSRNFKGTQYAEEALSIYQPRRQTFLLLFEGVGGLAALRNKYSFVELGWVDDQEEISRALNAADIFLMPSIAEGFGLMAVESMACGTPVIVFEGTALPETIDAPRCGVAVPYKDSRALAEAIRELLENDQRRRELRENGLRHVAEKHTFEIYGDGYLRLYRALREESRARV